MANSLAFSTALELAQQIRRRVLSPVELTQLYLDRIAQFDSQVGSFFTVAYEAAIAEAQAKTEQLMTFADEGDLPLLWRSHWH